MTNIRHGLDSTGNAYGFAHSCGHQGWIDGLVRFGSQAEARAAEGARKAALRVCRDCERVPYQERIDAALASGVTYEVHQNPRNLKRYVVISPGALSAGDVIIEHSPAFNIHLPPHVCYWLVTGTGQPFDRDGQARCYAYVTRIP
jgi:hypothetical protein